MSIDVRKVESVHDRFGNLHPVDKSDFHVLNKINLPNPTITQRIAQELFGYWAVPINPHFHPSRNRMNVFTGKEEEPHQSYWCYVHEIYGYQCRSVIDFEPLRNRTHAYEVEQKLNSIGCTIMITEHSAKAQNKVFVLILDDNTGKEYETEGTDVMQAICECTIKFLDGLKS